MDEITWAEFWAKRQLGVPDVSRDVNEVLSGQFAVISDHLYQYPVDDPTTVRACEDIVFLVDDKYFFAEKDSALVVYDGTVNRN